MNIHGFITLTLLDYPEHLAASIFLGGCNLRCPFCQNGNLVLSPENEPSISEEEVLAFLKKRSGILEGVCISGGEPTLYRELPDFISKIKALGYLVKLDTNGTKCKSFRAAAGCCRHTETSAKYQSFKRIYYVLRHRL